MMSERLAVVEAARTWIGTPYHHRASVKGPEGGVDCALIIKAAHVEAGLVEDFQVPKYTHDWHMHRSEEQYLSFLSDYARPVDDLELSLVERGTGWSALPATILMWKLGRTFSHGAIVTQWPFVVHAYHPSRRVIEETLEGHPLMFRPMRAYSLWGDAE